MKCVKCGIELEEGDVFCANCGTPVQNVNDSEGKNIFSYDRNMNNVIAHSQQQPINENYEKPNNAQQNYKQQGVDSQQDNNNQKVSKSKNLKSIIIIISIVGAILLVFITIFTIIIVFNITKRTILNINKENSNSTENNQVVQSNNNSNSNNNYTLANSMTIEGFTFYIPDNISYKVYNSDKMAILSDNTTWIANMMILEKNYKYIKSNTNTFIANISKNFGANEKISSPKVENINGVEFITFEVQTKEYNANYAFAQLNTQYSVFIMLSNNDDSLSKDGIDTIADIIKGAKYVGTSSHMEINKNINFNNIKDAIENINDTTINENK